MDNPMLESIWKAVSEASGRRWALASLMPAVLFWIAYQLTYFGVLWGWDATLRWWSGMTDSQRLFLMLVAVLTIALTAFGLDLIGSPLLRTMEGYSVYWAFLPILGIRLHNRRQEHWQRYFKPHWDRWRELNARQYPASAQTSPAQPLTKDELYELERLERVLRESPQETQNVMPTRLGNIVRAAAEDQYYRYGLDAVITWPRLFPLLPESLRADIDTARSALDGSVRLALLAVIFSVIWGVWAITTGSLALAVAGLLGLIVVWLAWRAALRGGALYAELMRSAFDLYRFDLYQALRLTLPTMSDAEPQMGKLLTSFLWRGGRIQYRNSPESEKVKSNPSSVDKAG